MITQLSMTLVNIIDTAWDYYSVFISFVPAIHLGYGLSGVWFAMCFDFLIRGFIFVVYTRKGSWKAVNV